MAIYDLPVNMSTFYPLVVTEDARNPWSSSWTETISLTATATYGRLLGACSPCDLRRKSPRPVGPKPGGGSRHRTSEGALYSTGQNVVRSYYPPWPTFRPPSIMPVAVKRSPPGCADQDAKAKKVGLWQDANPTTSWDFRAIQHGR